jgi:hypothetical protein
MTTIDIYDDVLEQFEAYRTRALAMRFQTVQDGVVQFQGIAPCADPTIPMWLKTHYPALDPTVSFFRQSPLGQVEPHLIHDDRSMGDVTAIFYLTEHPPEGDGTVFWRNIHTGATAATSITPEEMGAEAQSWFDASQWEIAAQVAAKPNRLIVFDAARYHSRAIPENYGEGPDARLIQVIFSTGALL